jgi:hypothetical protein
MTHDELTRPLHGCSRAPPCRGVLRARSSGAPLRAELDPCDVSISLWADMRMHLAVTDYGNFLQNEPSPLRTSSLPVLLI